MKTNTDPATLIAAKNTHAILQRGKLYFHTTAHTTRAGTLIAAYTDQQNAWEYLTEKNVERAEGEPPFELLPMDEACELVESAQAAEYIGDWKEITAEEWQDALEVLPPEKWRNVHGVEIFRMMEYLTGNITGHYARLGERYFCANRRTTAEYADLAAEVAFSAA